MNYHTGLESFETMITECKMNIRIEDLNVKGVEKVAWSNTFWNEDAFAQN